MSDREMLEIDIRNKKNAYEKIQEALELLKDVVGLDIEYQSLHNLAEDINDNRISDEARLERMEEIA